MLSVIASGVALAQPKPALAPLVGAAEVVKLNPPAGFIDDPVATDDQRIAYVVAETGSKAELHVYSYALKAEQVIDITAVSGPVVLACGTDDDIWESCNLQHRTLARLEAGRVEVTAVEAEGAGHFLAIGPYIPALDGTDGAADSAGRAAFWRAVVNALGPSA